jgi:hypothetical protein
VPDDLAAPALLQQPQRRQPAEQVAGQIGGAAAAGAGGATWRHSEGSGDEGRRSLGQSDSHLVQPAEQTNTPTPWRP